MQVLRLEKKRLNHFLNVMKKGFELIAPVKSDLVRFSKIHHAEEIQLTKNSYFPVKEYFFKKEETLFQFEGTRITVPAYEAKKRVFFGIRRCDLNAIKNQDIVFIRDMGDPYYKAARENSYLLGYHCNTAPSPYCFCGSLDLVDFFDLMFFDKEDHFLVEVGSEKGKSLTEKYQEFFTDSQRLITQNEKTIPGVHRLENKDISRFYDHQDWKKGADICLSCGACTTLCPTCYCFEIHDEVKTADPVKGERKREWSSCQLQEFTRVAGDHIFRKEREDRFKHRIYHQLQYFKEKYGVQMCVGCGRCIEGCPTRIDFVRILNEMKNGKTENNG